MPVKKRRGGHGSGALGKEKSPEHREKLALAAKAAHAKRKAERLRKSGQEHGQGSTS